MRRQEILKKPVSKVLRSAPFPWPQPWRGRAPVPGCCAREHVAGETKAVFASDSSEIAICQEPLERLKVNESVLESEGYHPH